MLCVVRFLLFLRLLLLLLLLFQSLAVLAHFISPSMLFPFFFVSSLSPSPSLSTVEAARACFKGGRKMGSYLEKLAQLLVIMGDVEG